MDSIHEIRTCPKCGRIYKDYPALSRRDNKTEICSLCGVAEAMEDFYKVFEEKDKRGENDSREFWIFTFGCGQTHVGKYVKIYGTFEEARSKMFEAYGDRWCFQYSEKEWNDWCERRPPYFPEETELEVIE